MNVISFKRIREFSLVHPDADNSLRAWFTTMRKSRWQNLVELKETYPAADQVGRYTVFNIKGNKYRLVCRIVYRSQTVFIVRILSHEEYALGRWKK